MNKEVLRMIYNALNSIDVHGEHNVVNMAFALQNVRELINKGEQDDTGDNSETM